MKRYILAINLRNLDYAIIKSMKFIMVVVIGLV